MTKQEYILEKRMAICKNCGHEIEKHGQRYNHRFHMFGERLFHCKGCEKNCTNPKPKEE